MARSRQSGVQGAQSAQGVLASRRHALHGPPASRAARSARDDHAADDEPEERLELEEVQGCCAELGMYVCMCVVSRGFMGADL